MTSDLFSFLFLCESFAFGRGDKFIKLIVSLSFFCSTFDFKDESCVEQTAKSSSFVKEAFDLSATVWHNPASVSLQKPLQ